MSPRPGGRGGRRAAARRGARPPPGGGPCDARAALGRGAPPAAVSTAGTGDRASAALGPFFDRLAALERGETRRVRVLWLGDSHVAADLLTGHARRLLQARFGDAGPGLVMPGNPWRFFRHDRARSRGDGGFETVGLGRDVVDPLVGPLGRCAPRRAARGARASRRRSPRPRSRCSPRRARAASRSRSTASPRSPGDVGDAVDGAPTPCSRVDGAVLRDGGVVAFVEPEGAAEAPRTLVVRDACGGAVRVLGRRPEERPARDPRRLRRDQRRGDRAGSAVPIASFAASSSSGSTPPSSSSRSGRTTWDGPTSFRRSTRRPPSSSSARCARTRRSGPPRDGARRPRQPVEGARAPSRRERARRHPRAAVRRGATGAPSSTSAP